MDDMVTIPRAEYERLKAAAEEAADIRAYDKAMDDLASGREHLIPAAFADRLIDGEAPLRVYRDWRGLTQAQLAEKAGVNRVQIADIEAGRASGSVSTVAKLARALGVDMESLIVEEG